MKPRYVIMLDKIPFHRVPVAGYFTPLSPMFRLGSVFLKLDKSHATPYPPGTVLMNFAAQERVALLEPKQRARGRGHA